jgi:dihydrofolate synthase/folylpolyglutamate synthase
MILDVAHNPAAAQVLAAYLAETPGSGRTLAIFGLLADKDFKGVATQLMPQISQWHLIPLETSRAMPVSEMALALEALGEEEIESHESPMAALARVQAEARPGDRILVTGSFYVVAAVKRLLFNPEQDA